MTSKWDDRYIELAKQVASWSKDKTKIGAVIVGQFGQILSTGYNGFPRKIADTEERLADRDVKLSYIAHAEMNCIYNACNIGVCLRDSTLYIYGLPVCSECAKGVIQCGVKRVYEMYDRIKFESAPHWIRSGQLSKSMFTEAGIEYTSLAF